MKTRAGFIVLFIFMVLGFGVLSASGGKENGQRTQEMRKQLYDIFTTMPPEGDSRGPTGSELAWGESYILMGFVSAYEATGDTLFLSRLCEHATNMFAIRDDFTDIHDDYRGRVIPAWSSNRYTNGKQYAWLVHAGMVTFPLARFVYLVRREPSLEMQFGDRARMILSRVRETVSCFDCEFVDGPSAGEGYYTGINGAILPLNQMNAMGRTCVALWLATGDRYYRDRASALANYLKNRLRLDSEKDAYDWSYRVYPDGSCEGSEDVSHASINADFAFQCCRAGIVFTKGDMKRFAHTVIRVIAAGDSISSRIDGSGGYNATYADQAGRWLHFSYFEPGVGDILYGYLSDRLRKGELGVPTGIITAAYYCETGNRGFRKEKPGK
ncbi:hypothetical protein LLG96_18755 [bacterium]|nr:hypothetical protein [bacterium]